MPCGLGKGTEVAICAIPSYSRGSEGYVFLLFAIFSIFRALPDQEEKRLVEILRNTESGTLVTNGSFWYPVGCTVKSFLLLSVLCCRPLIGNALFLSD